MQTFLKVLLLFVPIVIFSLLFEIFFNGFSLYNIYNLIENILFASILIFPLFFLKIRFRRFYLYIAYVTFVLFTILETAFYYIFKTSFSSSVIFVILDTNFDEAYEFVSFYLDGIIAVLLIISTLITTVGLIKISKFQFGKVKVNRRSQIIFLGIFFVIAVFLKLSTLIVYNLPYLMLKSSAEYFSDSKDLNYYRVNKLGEFKNISRPNYSEEEIYVIVIGESTTKNHMGIYGYDRATTPNLIKIKEDLLIYKNVISPNTYTTASLTKALTLGNYENPDLRYKGSIIQLLNKASFSTYWISNQKPVGVFDSQISSIALGADTTKFLNIMHPDEKTNYDEVLITELDKLMLEKEPKKVIFLHLLGTHMKYENRYPESFNYFNNKSIREDDDQAEFFINTYDNAIRYNDYIINEIKESVQKQNAKSFVLYFSDHGEEVFNEIEFVGHSADQIITQNIYEIPMLLWLSDKFIEDSDFVYLENRKYMLDDMFHSIADLLNIEAKEVDSTRSIFNKHFKERKRIIRESIDYDSLYPEAN